jgi:hypothetical protein
MDDLEARRVFGFNPRDRAAKPWLWHIDSEGRLAVVASASASFLDANYDGNDGPMAGGEALATHYWRPVRGKTG